MNEPTKFHIDWRGGALTAAVVGTLLLVINQWEALLGQTSVAWSKALLTYLVPFCVFQFGKYRAWKSSK